MTRFDSSAALKGIGKLNASKSTGQFLFLKEYGEFDGSVKSSGWQYIDEKRNLVVVSMEKSGQVKRTFSLAPIVAQLEAEGEVVEVGVVAGLVVVQFAQNLVEVFELNRKKMAVERQAVQQSFDLSDPQALGEAPVAPLLFSYGDQLAYEKFYAQNQQAARWQAYQFEFANISLDQATSRFDKRTLLLKWNPPFPSRLHTRIHMFHVNFLLVSAASFSLHKDGWLFGACPEVFTFTADQTGAFTGLVDVVQRDKTFDLLYATQKDAQFFLNFRRMDQHDIGFVLFEAKGIPVKKPKIDAYRPFVVPYP